VEKLRWGVGGDPQQRFYGVSVSKALHVQPVLQQLGTGSRAVAAAVGCIWGAVDVLLQQTDHGGSRDRTCRHLAWGLFLCMGWFEVETGLWFAGVTSPR
jgi:hypothetical protein